MKLITKFLLSVKSISVLKKYIYIKRENKNYIKKRERERGFLVQGKR